ncbi:MAG TPA: hypothetical protein VKA10_00030, partial [Prolixibacteraceae bacterium]|nr:hypothetical protein [Prolixibacteraceae bacterium]
MSEKDYIEKLFAENLNEINDNEPQDGHFERFQQKLKKQQQRKTISFRLVFQVAAAVVFVFLAVNQALIFFTPENQSDKLAEANNQKETTLA